MANVDVVVAADVLVAALSRVGPQTVTFRGMPPKTASAAADVIGTFGAPQDSFNLILSEDILEETTTALVQTHGAANRSLGRPGASACSGRRHQRSQRTRPTRLGSAGHRVAQPRPHDHGTSEVPRLRRTHAPAPPTPLTSRLPSPG
jgi:hypothetical protein